MATNDSFLALLDLNVRVAGLEADLAKSLDLVVLEFQLVE